MSVENNERHRLLEIIILNREPQFLVELTKELNKMLGIQTKLLMAFYTQTNSQTEHMNQVLEQYLQFLIDYRQKDQPKQLAIAEFAISSKVYTAAKISPFMVNYGEGKTVDRKKYQKKEKDRDSNRVCEENKKNTRRSRSSIEKSLERDKVASR